MKHAIVPALLVVFCCCYAPALACIWDRDTLAMERARFPEVNELIAGHFPRHSPAYYEWRRDQVLAIPVGDRVATDYDDLGASYDKLGQHDKAIQTMLDKIDRFPDEGLYETHANLGTFYIHNGDLEQGVQYIGSAIEINPDAHFGREVYQKLLVEYVIQQRAAGHTPPLEAEAVIPDPYGPGFGTHVLDHFHLLDEDNRFRLHEVYQEELQKAIKGILGMMRFGNYDSPILLEVLGDLIIQASGFDEGGGQRLAVRAYLKASYETEEVIASNRYREKAKSALGNQQGVSLEEIEADLKKEIAEGDAYFAQIVEDEKAWIAAGKDVDAEFKLKYYDNPVSFQPASSKGDYKKGTRGYFALAAIGMGIIVAIGAVASYISRSKGNHTSERAEAS